MNEMDVEQEPEEEKSMALTKVVAEGDPKALLAHLESKAAVAARMRSAIETILISQTYPQDWSIQGAGDKAKACLSSAGAERIARSFPIRYRDVKWKKEVTTDSEGEAYRYVYEGYAELENRVVYVHGSYSTRDNFLGKADGEWKALENINENSIRSAAYHIFCGNAIKELLGLRGMPAAEYQRIMGGTGRDAAKSTKVDRGQGTQGGSSEDDHRHQVELGEICMAIANAGCTVAQDAEGKWSLTDLSESEDRKVETIAGEICALLSGFTGDKGPVAGKNSPRLLKGKWLSSTLGKARALKESLDKNDAGAPWG
ncbi:MAG: hypothetical protein WCY09_10110 [Candidatus Omnitrophota bacterium]